MQKLTPREKADELFYKFSEFENLSTDELKRAVRLVAEDKIWWLKEQIIFYEQLKIEIDRR